VGVTGRFAARVGALPLLGLGVSTEYGAADAPGALDPLALRATWPKRASFLEVGVEVGKGLDRHALAWAAAGLPTTYHFLDINLDEPDDFDAAWLDGVRAITGLLRPAWMCGDAGLWHVGPRDRGSMLLLPPVLTASSASAMADGVRALRDATGLEVLPENPPGTVFVGDLHLLDFFARVAEEADTGLLVDVAHLLIYQRARGGAPFDGLDGLPMDRIVEVHVAGGVERVTPDGYAWIEDDHSPNVLAGTWALLERIVPRAPNLKAVVFECERNPAPALGAAFERLEATLSGWAR
jgi:uncharacterized protein (UPF0276 family)